MKRRGGSARGVPQGSPLYTLRSVFPPEPSPPPTEPLVRRRDELLDERRRMEAALARAKERQELHEAKSEHGAARCQHLRLRAAQLRAELELERRALGLQQRGLSELRAKLQELQGQAPKPAKKSHLHSKAWVPAGRPAEQLEPASAAPRRGTDVELVDASRAQLRHPRGAEALVDLRTGCLQRWSSAAGRVARDVTSLRLVKPELGVTTFWRLTRMDDSNGEPSISLTASGTQGEAAWRAVRTLRLGAASFSESLVLENLSSDAVLAFSLREERAEGAAEAGAAAPGAPAPPPLAVRKDGATQRPASAQQLLPPLSSRSASQHWKFEES